MAKQNFYQGQKVTPADVNQGLSGYADNLAARLWADAMGTGLVQGFGAEIISGFILGIAPGLAYNARGQRLALAQGVQLNLASSAPAVGTNIVKVWALPDYIKSEPVIDGEGNTVYTKLEETAAFGFGDGVPAGALHLYDVQLSTGAILIINPAYGLLETPLAQSLRTRGYTYNGGNPKITAPNGFEVDLLTLATRRAVFDALKPGGCKKGDIIWLEPPTYETQTTPPVGGGVAYPYKTTGFMGKEITYSAQTNYRQYAVRLRALVDNPRNPNIVGAIGTDWAVDDPSAIVEEGSNSNGSYVMFAGRKSQQFVWKNYTMNNVIRQDFFNTPYPLVIPVSGNTRTDSNGNSSARDFMVFIAHNLSDTRINLTVGHAPGSNNYVTSSGVMYHTRYDYWY